MAKLTREQQELLENSPYAPDGTISYSIANPRVSTLTGWHKRVYFPEDVGRKQKACINMLIEIARTYTASTEDPHSLPCQFSDALMKQGKEFSALRLQFDKALESWRKIARLPKDCPKLPVECEPALKLLEIIKQAGLKIGVIGDDTPKLAALAEQIEPVYEHALNFGIGRAIANYARLPSR